MMHILLFEGVATVCAEERDRDEMNRDFVLKIMDNLFLVF